MSSSLPLHLCLPAVGAHLLPFSPGFSVLFSLTIRLSSSGGLCSFHFLHCLLVVMHPPFLHPRLLNSLLLRSSHTSGSVLICFILFAPLFAPAPDCLDFFLLFYLTPSFLACSRASSPPLHVIWSQKQHNLIQNTHILPHEQHL